MKIKDRAIRMCETYAQVVKNDPEFKTRTLAKVWAFSDIGVLTFEEVIHYIDMITDSANEAERRIKKCM